MGTNVSLAARMEPVTPPGEVYCIQAFAALTAADGVQDFACEYVGKKKLPKRAGTHPMYVLKAKTRHQAKVVTRKARAVDLTLQR